MDKLDEIKVIATMLGFNCVHAPADDSLIIIDGTKDTYVVSIKYNPSVKEYAVLDYYKVVAGFRRYINQKHIVPSVKKILLKYKEQYDG